MATSKLNSLATTETLATNAYLIRIGNVRVLHLNGYSGAGNALTIPSNDRPSTSCAVPSLVGGATNDFRLGEVSISSTGNVNRYYVGTYHSTTSGLSSVASTDKTFAVAVWTIG